MYMQQCTGVTVLGQSLLKSEVESAHAVGDCYSPVYGIVPPLQNLDDGVDLD
ncbi:unnamed protein product [Amoebophrya sp. A120]|nr:unnamed protein product [Amoebophrya sp. A120]|eukprot:GSA120T00026039001.1